MLRKNTKKSAAMKRSWAKRKAAPIVQAANAIDAVSLGKKIHEEAEQALRLGNPSFLENPLAPRPFTYLGKSEPTVQQRFDAIRRRYLADLEQLINDENNRLGGVK